MRCVLDAHQLVRRPFLPSKVMGEQDHSSRCYMQISAAIDERGYATLPNYTISNMFPSLPTTHPSLRGLKQTLKLRLQKQQVQAKTSSATTAVL